MSRMTSSSSGLPVLYSTLKTNYDSITSLASNETAHQNAKWEKTLETSLEAVLDDLLMYQGILAVGRDDGESSSQPVVRYFIAIKFGDSKYQIAQLVINVVLCVLYIYEAIRTRYWKHLPDFDFVDVKALMLAALGPETTQQQVTSASSGPLLFAKGRENDVKLVAQYEGSKPRIRYAEPRDNLQQTGSSDGAHASSLGGTDGDITPSGDSNAMHADGKDIAMTHLRAYSPLPDTDSHYHIDRRL